MRTGVEVVLDGGPGQQVDACRQPMRGEEASVRGPVVVLGDTLLDRDVEGVVNRLCPDSPVPVLDETAATDRPGGAGLAAVFAAAQGAEVVLVTALADDAGGARLSALLAAAGVQVYRAGPVRRHPGEDPAAGPGPGAAAPRPGRHAGRAGAARPTAVLAGCSPRRRRCWSATTAGGWPGSRRCGRRWPPPARRWSGTRIRAARRPVPGVHLATPNESEVRELVPALPGGSRLAAASRGAPRGCGGAGGPARSR